MGYNIAHYISGQGIDVSVIDQSKNLISRISDSMDVQAFIGHASDPETLGRAGGDDIDLMIAVTRDDEVNMLACQIGYSLFEIDTKIARIRNPHYLSHEGRKLFSNDHIPVDAVISPEDEVAEHIKRNFLYPGVLEVIPMAEGKVSIIGVRCTSASAIVKTPLRQLTSLFPDLPMRVLAIIRVGNCIIPSAEEQIYEGDEVYFSVGSDAIGRALDCFNLEPCSNVSAVIIGGGRVAQHLAAKLVGTKQVSGITMIEKNRDIAYNAAERLPSVNLLHGDVLDEDIMREANLRENDIVACVTNSDEVNIFGALLAKRLHVYSAMSLVTSDVYGDIAESVSIDSVIRPSEITTSSILRFIRLGHFVSAYSLRSGAVEILEGELPESSSLSGSSLRDKKLHGLIAGAILRKGELIIPGGNTKFRAGDKVIFAAERSSVRAAEKLFSAGIAG